MLVIFCVLIIFLCFFGRVPTPFLIAAAVFFAICAILRRILHGEHRHDTLDFDVLAGQDSALHRFSPAAKTFLTVCAVVSCLLADHFLFAGVLFVTDILLLRYAGKISFHDIISGFSAPAVFILCGSVTLLLPFTHEAGGLFSIPLFGGYLTLSPEGQLGALHLICNAFASVSALLLLGMTTPIAKIVSVCRSIRLPKVVIELMVLIYRYLILLSSTLGHMQAAAKTRLGYLNLRTTMKSAKLIAAQLIILAFEKASANFDAMEARCYEGDICFLTREERMGKMQWCLSLGFFALLACGLTAAKLWKGGVI